MGTVKEKRDKSKKRSKADGPEADGSSRSNRKSRQSSGIDGGDSKVRRRKRKIVEGDTGPQEDELMENSDERLGDGIGEESILESEGKSLKAKRPKKSKKRDRKEGEDSKKDEKKVKGTERSGEDDHLEEISEHGGEGLKSKRRKTSANETMESTEEPEESLDNAEEVIEKNKDVDQTPLSEKKKYNELIVFVGQLPYSATKETIKEHFGRFGVYDILSIRLLTDKKTKRSRGIAFLELGTASQLVLALRCHHTQVMGRMINVERTVGGGGIGDKRKEKLASLRSMQNTQVEKDVRAKIAEVLENNPETLVSQHDFDDRAVETLGTFPKETVEGIVTEFIECRDIESVENRSAWLMGIIKKYREKLKFGNDFVQSKQSKRTGRKGHHTRHKKNERRNRY